MAEKTHDIHEEEISEKPFDPKLMRRLLGYLKPYRGWVALAFGLILVTSGARQAGPYLTKIAVDDHMLKGDLPGLNRVVFPEPTRPTTARVVPAGMWRSISSRTVSPL